VIMPIWRPMMARLTPCPAAVRLSIKH